MTHPTLRLTALAISLGIAFQAAAVTNDENNATIPFSFSSPGARSLGMGGAFIGLADDATAAYTNPAGLMGLGLEPQFSVEVRRNDFTSEYATGGTFVPGSLDYSGVDYGRASGDTSNLSFLSFVWPAERWAIAVYRHQLLDYENAFSSGAIDIGNDFSTFPVVASAQMEIVNYGVSGAWRLTDALSIGGGLSWYDFEIDTTASRYDLASDVSDPANVVNRQRQFGDDDDIGFNLGLLFRGSDNFQVGLSYRSEASFDYRATSEVGPANLINFISEELGSVAGQAFSDHPASFTAPDTFGIGFAFRASDALTLTMDVNKIDYSDVTEDMSSAFFNAPGDTALELTFENGQVEPVPTLSEFDAAILQRLQIEDVIEPRLGLEYVFLNMNRPLSLRLGAWYEERHTIRFQGDLNAFDDDPDVSTGAANAALFSAGDDEMHYSVGLGWAFSSFQIDFAADMSDRQDTLSLSGVWRF